MDVKAKGTPRVCHREWKKTPASLGYPLSVFNKNSTLKQFSPHKKTTVKFDLRHSFAAAASQKIEENRDKTENTNIKTNHFRSPTLGRKSKKWENLNQNTANK